MKKTAAPKASPPSAKSGAGAKLKALRLRKRLSLQDIYIKTRIRPEILKSIEEGAARPPASAQKPSKAHLRLFVKAYARALGMDEGEALRAFFKEESGEEETRLAVRKPKRSTRQPPAKKTLAIAGFFLLAALAVLPFAGAFFYFENGFLKGKEGGSSSASQIESRPLQPPRPLRAEERAKIKEAEQIKNSAKPLSQLIEEGFYANSLLIKSQTDKVMYFKAEGGKTATIALKPGLWHALKAPGAIYIRLDGRSRLALAHKGRLSFWTSKGGFEKTLPAP